MPFEGGGEDESPAMVAMKQRLHLFETEEGRLKVSVATDS
jgi:hypothetical protein